MLAKGVTVNDVQRAVSLVNATYVNNVELRDFTEKRTSRGVHTRFTLRVRDCRGPGHRISPSGKRLIFACWHVHRDVLRALFQQHPTTVVEAGVFSLAHPREKTVYRGLESFEAQHRDVDRYIGGTMLFSDACQCREPNGGNANAQH